MESPVQGVSKPKRKGRVWRILGAIVLGLILLLYLVFPFTMGAIASARKPQVAELPPDEYEAVVLTAKDGTPLAGWYAAGENGACILLIHGSNENLASLSSHASFLIEAGYGVFALTLRGHGDSGGRGNALGWDCGQDVSAAVSYLKSNGVQRIGALGLSLGGEVLLASAADEPELRAIVADGATHRLRTISICQAIAHSGAAGRRASCTPPPRCSPDSARPNEPYWNPSHNLRAQVFC